MSVCVCVCDRIRSQAFIQICLGEFEFAAAGNLNIHKLGRTFRSQRASGVSDGGMEGWRCIIYVNTERLWKGRENKVSAECIETEAQIML